MFLGTQKVHFNCITLNFLNTNSGQVSMSKATGNSTTEFNDDDIDFSDIEQSTTTLATLRPSSRYRVPYEDGFDAIIVIDNLPVVELSKKDKLLQVLNKHLKKCNASKPDNDFMLWDDVQNQK